MQGSAWLCSVAKQLFPTFHILHGRVLAATWAHKPRRFILFCPGFCGSLASDVCPQHWRCEASPDNGNRSPHPAIRDGWLALAQRTIGKRQPCHPHQVLAWGNISAPAETCALRVALFTSVQLKTYTGLMFLCVSRPCITPFNMSKYSLFWEQSSWLWQMLFNV